MFSEENVSLEFIAQLLYMEVTLTHSNITFQPIRSSTVTEANVHLVISGDDESAFSPYGNKKNSSCNTTLYIDLFFDQRKDLAETSDHLEKRWVYISIKFW